MGFILHITPRAAWDEALARGIYEPASLRAEGFIHCSAIDQAADTANAFYAGQRGLVLLCIDAQRVTAPLRYEPPAGHVPHGSAAAQLFPHLYGALHLDAVTAVVDFAPGADGIFRLPERISHLTR